MTARLLITAVLIATTAGCAVGAEDVDSVSPKGRVDSGKDSGSDDDDTGSSSTPDDTGSSSSGDTGSSSSDDTGTATDTSTGTPCTTLTGGDCMASSETMGGVSGDTGGTSNATGTDGKFLRVRVSEDDSSLFSSKDLKVRITLTSTSGNFDLFVYQGQTAGDGGGFECTTVKSSSTEPAGTPDVVSLAWNDNRPVGGHDDTRWISIEVRPADPTCDGASWSLKVEGNK